MIQADVEAFVEALENVQREENYGYVFYFVGEDHRLPFTTIAETDNEYENVSQLSREGVYRVNIGVSKATFDSLVGSADMEKMDYAALNVFMPHPDYAKQHFVCILNPSGENETTTKRLIVEAYSLAAGRVAKKAGGRG
jgi:hypothetical protein